jgi:hypothetical protein
MRAGAGAVGSADELCPPALAQDEREGLITRWFTEDEPRKPVDSGRMEDAPSLAARSLFARYRALNGDLLG